MSEEEEKKPNVVSFMEPGCYDTKSGKQAVGMFVGYPPFASTPYLIGFITNDEGHNIVFAWDEHGRDKSPSNPHGMFDLLAKAGNS